VFLARPKPQIQTGDLNTMIKKVFLCVSMAALFGLTAVSAKSYDIVIDKAEQAGQVQLPKGEYNVKVDGSNVTFKNVASGKTYSTTAHLENADKKFGTTSVEMSSDSITAIELGGSTTKVLFQ
jgi:hypothetical protein